MVQGRANIRDGVLSSKHRLYSRYREMKARCLRPSHKAYKGYGGRGITICSRWLASFWNFVDDMDATFKPGLEIDRINNDGHYEPDNCRWATDVEQRRNQRDRKLSLQEVRAIRSTRHKWSSRKWADFLGVSVETVKGIRARKTWKNDDYEGPKPKTYKRHDSGPGALTPEKIREIRATEQSKTAREWAEELGLKTWNIYDIWRGKSFRDVR